MKSGLATRDVPPLQLRAMIAPGSVNEEARTVDVEWTTGAPVLRGYYDKFYEELSLNPKHVRMGRLNNGAPMLDTHEGYSALRVYGVVVQGSAKLESKRGVATVRFDTAENDPDAEKLFRKIVNGIVRNVSVGYRIYRFEKVEGGDEKIPTYRATDWEPYEISAVPMGADDGAGFRAAEDRAPNACAFITRNKDDLTMTTISEDAATTDERTAAQMRTLIHASQAAVRMGFPRLRADALLADATMTPERFRETVFAELAARDDAAAGNARVSGPGGGQTFDNPDFARSQMVEYLTAKTIPGYRPSTDAYRHYAGLTLIDLGRDMAEAAGIRTRGLSPENLLRALRSVRGTRGDFNNISHSRGSYITHSTSDFTLLQEEFLNKLLREKWAALPLAILQISHKTTARDFRDQYRLQTGDIPPLEKVGENGEIKATTILGASRANYRITQFGNMLGISKQSIVNDDLNAFDRIAQSFVLSGREAQAMAFIDLLKANSKAGPTMSDGKTFFHADHGNLATSAGAPSVATLGEARKLMRLQKSGGDQPIAMPPARTLLVPASLETLSEQVLTALYAARVEDVNPFSGKLTLAVEPRLDAVSATGWYLSADQGFAAIEHASLEGEDEPLVETREGWEVLGTEFRCTMTFGCGAIDWRGLIRNAGA